MPSRDRLKKHLVEALLALHEAIRRDHPADPIRAFGLLAGNEGDSIEPFFHLQSHLDELAAHEGADSQPEFFVLEPPEFETTQKYEHLFHDATEYYRTFFENEDDDTGLDDLHAELYNVMLASIRAVERKGIFGKGKDRDHVFLFLHTLEMADAEIDDFAAQLNPKSVLEWALGPSSPPLITGRLIAVGKISSNRYDDLSMTPDGKLLAISGWGGNYRVWDTNDFSLEKSKFSTYKLGFTACALSIDGEHLYLAWRDQFPDERGILEALTSKSKRGNAFSTHGREVWALATHPAMNLLATGEDNGGICLWQETDKKLLHSFRAQSGAIHSMVFSPDGTRLFTASRESGIRAWDTGNWNLLWQHPLGTNALAISPDGRQLACLAFEDIEEETVHLRNSADGTSQRDIQLTDDSARDFDPEHSGLYFGAKCLAYSRDGRRLAIGVGFGEDSAHTRLYDLSSGEKIATCHSGHECVSGLGFLPDDQTIAITGNHHRGAALYLWTPGV